ncbi:VanZ family protein [Anaerostipes sp.]|uniref:VanZ family protein n=1 Tax=Anaerostipes sp. TaxID=1872530 RepID=UPI0025BD17A7|nr:VanZ family protein [Anaerostipes sp.]MBS7008797.1 VanZ family protein [Anaerostipes sp.]
MRENFSKGAILLAQALTAGLIIYGMTAAVLKVMGKTKSLKNGNWVLHCLFTIYLIFIGIVTGMFSFDAWSLHGAHNYNLIPFIGEDLSYIILNVLLFLPMGVFLPLVQKKENRSLKRTILFVFSLSLIIECVQFFFVGRLADIDDLIANTLGGVLGYALYKSIFCLTNRYVSSKTPGLGTYSIVISIITLFFGFTFPPMICYGDMILARFGIPIWSGNQNGIISLDGLHYSLYLYLTFSILGIVTAIRHPNDLGSKIGRYVSCASILYFTVKIVLNLIYTYF